jgi:hypothetical protein
MQCPVRQYEIHELNRVCAPYGRNSSLLYNSLDRGFLAKEKVDQIQCSLANALIRITHWDDGIVSNKVVLAWHFLILMKGGHFNGMPEMQV